ncbi:unnamed protein product [Rhodiola kirilowii]
MLIICEDSAQPSRSTSVNSTTISVASKTDVQHHLCCLDPCETFLSSKSAVKESYML